jgi:hypothetical protein
MTPDELQDDEGFFAYLDLLDDCSAWSFEVMDEQVPERLDVFHGTAETVDDAVAQVRRIVAEKLNVDESSFEVVVLARIDERHARFIDRLHQTRQVLEERPRSRGRHHQRPTTS